MECTGALDELRAQTAFARLMLIERDAVRYADEAAFLLWLLHAYFSIGAQCSDPANRHPEYRTVDISPEHLAHLEAFQARLEERVRLPRAFIVTGANLQAASIDVAATFARRLERAIVRLHEAVPGFEAVQLLPFVNRLSDTLFMLARHVDGGDFHVVDYDAIGSANPDDG